MATRITLFGKTWNRVWQEDDAGTIDREQYRAAWLRLFGRAYDTESPGPTLEDGDSWWHNPLGTNAVMCHAPDGSSIYTAADSP